MTKTETYLADTVIVVAERRIAAISVAVSLISFDLVTVDKVISVDAIDLPPDRFRFYLKMVRIGGA
jgi:hypothetical protein